MVSILPLYDFGLAACKLASGGSSGGGGVGSM